MERSEQVLRSLDCSADAAGHSNGWVSGPCCTSSLALFMAGPCVDWNAGGDAAGSAAWGSPATLPQFSLARSFTVHCAPLTEAHRGPCGHCQLNWARTSPAAPLSQHEDARGEGSRDHGSMECKNGRKDGHTEGKRGFWLSPVSVRRSYSLGGLLSVDRSFQRCSEQKAAAPAPERRRRGRPAAVCHASCLWALTAVNCRPTCPAG